MIVTAMEWLGTILVWFLMCAASLLIANHWNTMWAGWLAGSIASTIYDIIMSEYRRAKGAK